MSNYFESILKSTLRNCSKATKATRTPNNSSETRPEELLSSALKLLPKATAKQGQNERWQLSHSCMPFESPKGLYQDLCKNCVILNLTEYFFKVEVVSKNCSKAAKATRSTPNNNSKTQPEELLSSAIKRSPYSHLQTKPQHYEITCMHVKQLPNDKTEFMPSYYFD